MANAHRLGSLNGAFTFCDAVNSANLKNTAINAVCVATIKPKSAKVFSSDNASLGAMPRCSMNIHAAQYSPIIRMRSPKNRLNCRVDDE